VIFPFRALSCAFSAPLPRWLSEICVSFVCAAHYDHRNGGELVSGADDDGDPRPMDWTI